MNVTIEQEQQEKNIRKQLTEQKTKKKEYNNIE